MTTGPSDLTTIYHDGDMICGGLPPQAAEARSATWADVHTARERGDIVQAELIARLATVTSVAYEMHLDDPDTCVRCGNIRGTDHADKCEIGDAETFLELSLGKQLPWNVVAENDEF